MTLAADSNAERRARALLSADEFERCERFKFPELRRRYAIARATLRQILGHVLEVEPAAIAFAYGPHEKPALADTAAGLIFNVSHSDDVALVAVGRCEELGVDVEVMKEKRACRGIAERFFASEEIDALSMLEGHDYTRGFYRVWTRKESCVKARGGGLTIPLTSFAVSAGPEPRLLRLDGRDDLAEWRLVSVPPSGMFEGCVAARGAGAVAYFDWPHPEA